MISLSYYTLRGTVYRPFILLIILVTGLNSLTSTVNAQGMSESVENVLQSIQKVVGSMQDYIGDAQGCRFTCPGGEHPVPKSKHIPSSNGCGAFGIKLDSGLSMNAVTDCCDKHDMCYDTCLKKKTDCDVAFRDCLTSICRKAKKIVSEQVYSACKSTADLMYSGTMALGCKPYKDAQKNACICKRHYKEDL